MHENFETLVVLKVDSVEGIINILNNFDDNIRFMNEEVKSKLLFLSLLLERNGDGTVFSVYEKLECI